MLKHILAIQDVKMNFCYGERIVPEVGPSMRSFYDECQNPDNQMSSNVKDFNLVSIGTIETETMEITPDFKVLMHGDLIEREFQQKTDIKNE